MPAAEALRELVEWSRPAAESLDVAVYLNDVERLLREGNGAQRQGRLLAAGASIHDVHADAVGLANAILDDDRR